MKNQTETKAVNDLAIAIMDERIKAYNASNPGYELTVSYPTSPTEYKPMM